MNPVITNAARWCSVASWPECRRRRRSPRPWSEILIVVGRDIALSLRNAGIQIGAAALGTASGRKLDDREVETVIRIVAEPAK